MMTPNYAWCYEHCWGKDAYCLHYEPKGFRRNCVHYELLKQASREEVEWTESDLEFMIKAAREVK